MISLKDSTRRRYWDARPCNIRHSAKPVDSYEYSQEVRNRKYAVEPHILRFADHPLWYNSQVLDLGAGIGTDSLEFARHGAWVTAVDFSTEALAILSRRARAEGLDDQITVRVDDVETLQRFHLREVFHLVYSFGVLHHTPNPLSALKRAWALTKPGGELRIMLYHRYSFKALWILATYGKFQFWKWGELIQEHSEAQSGCPLTRTYARDEAISMVVAAGWTVTKIQVEHIFPYRIKDYKEGRLVKEWYWRYMPRLLFRVLERLFGWHLLIWARKEV